MGEEGEKRGLDSDCVHEGGWVLFVGGGGVGLRMWSLVFVSDVVRTAFDCRVQP